MNGEARRAQERDGAKIFALVRRARYREALILADGYRREHPLDPYYVYRYAVLLGDRQDGLAPPVIEKNRREAVRLLKPLMLRLRCFEAAERARIRNEYYWFGRKRIAQWKLGQAEEARGSWRGAYSCGVGAAWHAYDLAKKGRWSRARRWAREARAAWRRFLRHDRYYNAYVHLGLALGVAGRIDEMEHALRTGAKLSGRRTDWHEFSEIRKIVGALHR